MAQRETDIESVRNATKCLDEYLPGYVDFSHFIASDYSLSIYRKFATLGARNLLYLEAELQLIEFQLREFDETDKVMLARSDISGQQRTTTENATRSWDDLKEQALEGDEKQADKLRLIYKLRVLIKDYEEALLRRNQILALEKPAAEPFEAFTGWFRDNTPLRGSGFHLLDDEEDMIALGSQAEPDRMSSILHRLLGYYLRKKRKTPKSWGAMYYYPADRVNLIVAIISILIAAMLLVGAILTLYFVKPIGIRVGLVGVFTVVFAVSIMLFTFARRVEVYGATAAYAAVLVVFISVN